MITKQIKSGIDAILDLSTHVTVIDVDVTGFVLVMDEDGGEFWVSSNRLDT